MRPGATFSQENPAKSPAASATAHSAWHSPVPYLFGGLAAMLGLIAFSLLILACSYWKLSGYLDADEDGSAPADGVDAEKSGDGVGKLAATVYEERIVVIMAGEKKPTFLAMPMSSRASSFGDKNAGGDGEGNGNGDNKNEKGRNERTGNSTEDEDQREERQGRQDE